MLDARADDGAARAEFSAPTRAAPARPFDIELRIGAGAYVCGEETSLLESIEGKRALVRFKPPVPAISGLFGAPTLIHNVLTLAAATTILAQGGDAYAAFGVGRSRGTMPFQLCGNIARGGIVELPFGVTLRRLIDEFGGGSLSGRPLRAAQVGGPLGAYLPPSLWDTPLDYEAFAREAAMLGHGGVVAFDDTRRSRRAGGIRDAVLRARIVRKMHAVPDRLGARRRSDSTHSARRSDRFQRCIARRSVRNDGGRFVVCVGWTHADARTQYSPSLSRRT